MAHEKSENLQPPLSPYEILTLFLTHTVSYTQQTCNGLAVHRRFSNANFTRRHHHLIYISSRLYTLFSLFYKYTHTQHTHYIGCCHCPMGLTAISDHHLISTRLSIYSPALCCHARPAWIGVVVVSKVYHEMCLCIIQPIYSIYMYVVLCVYSFPLLTMRNFIIHITAIAEEMEQ